MTRDNQHAAAPIVDVHCHMFNAADLPIEGFVRHVALQDHFGAGALAPLAVKLIGQAPGYDQERRRLQALLAGGFELAPVKPIDDKFGSEVDLAVSELSDAERAEIGILLPSDAVSGGESLEGGVEALSPATAFRFVSWAKLFGQSRADLAVLYAKYFQPAADLAIPMLVDLNKGVGDTAATTLEQQVEMFDLLSQASMRSLLPGAENQRIHPFAGFDPFRILDNYVAVDGRSAEQVLKDAVLEHGFVGVKVYPEMGWSPSGNTSANAGSAARAAALDGILEKFFGWCAENDVPVTAHCNHSNFSSHDWSDANLGTPDKWIPVLNAHPALRVNLGHFGGAHDRESAYTWGQTIAQAMTRFPDRLFADVGCHRVDDERTMATLFDVLREMAGRTNVLDQLMFGTDWYMEANNPGPKKFTERYRGFYLEAFGAAATEKFMGANALRFLGFSSHGFSENGARVRKRYEKLGAPEPEWLGDR